MIYQQSNSHPRDKGHETDNNQAREGEEGREGTKMSTNAELQRKQLESMTTEQISLRIEQSQCEMNMFMEQLVTRASLQGYAEQQYDVLLALLQELLAFIGKVPMTQEWGERRDELVSKVEKKI